MLIHSLEKSEPVSLRVSAKEAVSSWTDNIVGVDFRPVGEIFVQSHSQGRFQILPMLFGNDEGAEDKDGLGGFGEILARIARLVEIDEASH